MKHILICITFLLAAAGAHAQILKGAGILYFDSIPNVNANTAGAELAFGIKTQKLYQWNRNDTAWVEVRNGLFTVNNDGDTLQVQVAIVPDGSGLSFRNEAADVSMSVTDNNAAIVAGGAGVQAVKSLGQVQITGDSLVIVINGGTGSAGQAILATGDGGATWGTVATSDTSGYNITFAVEDDSLKITDGAGTLAVALTDIEDGNGIYSGSGTVPASTTALYDVTGTDTLVIGSSRFGLRLSGYTDTNPPFANLKEARLFARSPTAYSPPLFNEIYAEAFTARLQTYRNDTVAAMVRTNGGGIGLLIGPSASSGGAITFGAQAAPNSLPVIRPTVNSFWRHNTDGTGVYVAADSLGGDGNGIYGGSGALGDTMTVVDITGKGLQFINDSLTVELLISDNFKQFTALVQSGADASLINIQPSIIDINATGNILFPPLTKNNAYNRILVQDSVTRQLFYIDKTSIAGGGGSVFANNAASMSGDTVQLGGPLIKNTTIDGTSSGYTLTVTGVKSTGAIFNVSNSGATTVAEGGNFSSVNGSGLAASSTNSVGATFVGGQVGLTALGQFGTPGGILTTTHSNGDLPFEAATFRRNTTGTAAAGIGAKLGFYIDATSASNAEAGALGFVWEDVGTTTRSSKFNISTVKSGSGTPTDIFSVDGNGQIKAIGYVTDSLIGTGWARLAVQSDGTVVADTTTTTGGSGTWLKPELETGDVTINSADNTLAFNITNSTSPTYTPAIRVQHDTGTDDVYATGFEMADTVGGTYLRIYHENGSYRIEGSNGLTVQAPDTTGTITMRSGQTNAQVVGGVNGMLRIRTGYTEPGRILLTDYTQNNGVSIASPDTAASNWTLTLPEAPPADGQVLTAVGTDGKTEWATGGSGGVTGSGTTGTIPVWSGSTALGNSPLTVSSGNVTATGTGAFSVPVGTTAQQPGTPTAGMTRYNSTTGWFEYRGASGWNVPVLSATGLGTTTAGRVFYAAANGGAAADDDLYWSSATNRLGIGGSPTAAVHIYSPTGGQNNGILLQQIANNAASQSSYASIDFQVPSGLIGQFLSTASNYSASGVNLAGNSVALTSLSSQLWLVAGNASGFINFNVGGYGTSTERMRITAAGNVGIGTASPQATLHVTGSFSRGAPVTKTGDFTVAATENWLIVNNASANTTVTLPTASTNTGRELMLKNLSASFTVISNASNVVPLIGGAAGTAILPATAGAWCTLVSDGTNWIIMQSN
jgi:hypothetical protein